MPFSDLKRIKGITLKGLIIVLLCGAIFGYGTGVISNVSNSYFLKRYAIKSEYTTSFVTSSAIYGALIGGFLAGFLNESIGRKKALLIGSILGLVGNTVAMLAFDLYFVLAIGRLIWGVSLGILSSTGPLYLSETTPSDLRGFLGVFFQFSITFTIFLGSLGAFFIKTENSWLFMLGLIYIPSVPLVFAVLAAPESPRYLADKNRQLSEELFNEIYPNDNARIQKEIDGIIESKSQNASLRDVISSKNSRALIIGLILCVAQQWTGINAIIYYYITLGKTFFGDQHTKIALSFAGIMLWNCVTSMGAIPLTSSKNRRTLMLLGQLIMFVALAITAIAFFFSGMAVNVLAILGICIFILGFEISVGPLFFVIINEIFPESHRGLIGSAMTGIQWACNAILTTAFPFMIKAISPNYLPPNGYVFFIFMSVGILTFVYQLFFLPETRNKDFKEIQEILQNKGTYFQR